MPLDQIPAEIREEFEKISNTLKEENPDWSDEKRAKVTWGIIKQRYFKDKNGKWTLREKFRSSASEGFKNWWALIKARGIAVEEEKMENPIELLVTASIIQPPSNWTQLNWDPFLAKASTDMPPRKDDDLIFIKQRLLHSDPFVNSNRFVYPREDLTKAVEGGQFKPEAGSYVDVNHDGIIRGWVIDAELEQAEVDGAAVVGLNVYKVFLAYRYPDIARYIIEAHKNGLLKASMACNPKEIECSICNQRFATRGLFTSHEHGNTGNLILHEPRFRASSIILPPFTPADKKADALDIAQKVKEKGEVKSVTDATDYLEYKKYKEEKEKEQDIWQILWEVTDVMRAIVENILKKEGLDDKKALIANVFNEAYKDLIAQLNLESVIKSMEDDEMEKVEELTKRIEALEAQLTEKNEKIRQYEEEDRNKELKTKGDEIEALKTQNMALAAEKEALQKKAEEQEAENKGLTAKIEKLSAAEKELLEVKVTAQNAERKAKIEALKLEEGKTKELISEFELKLTEGKVEGKSDDIFNALIRGFEYNPKEAPASDKVIDSEKKGTIPAGGKQGNDLNEKLKKLAHG